MPKTINDFVVEGDTFKIEKCSLNIFLSYKSIYK